MDKMIIIGTHGRFGEELIQSAEMIIGKMDCVKCCSLTKDMSFEDYRSSVEELMMDYSGEILCLVDLFGGTPSNVISVLSKKYHAQVITGLNLPMLIEVYMNLADMSAEELAELALQTLNESGKNVNMILGT